MKSFRFIYAVVLTAFLLCISQALPAQQQTASLEHSDTATAGSSVATSVPSGSYVIGSEDVLAVNIWKEPEVSRTVPVRPDGKITLPLVGDIQARGLTPLRLQQNITDQLRAYISNPEVTVIVQEVKSQKFNIVGEISKPGSYPLGQPMSVLDGIAVAGGLRDFAKESHIYVLRSDGGSRVRIPFNYKQVIKGKKLSQNIELKPGDTIVIP